MAPRRSTVRTYLAGALILAVAGLGCSACSTAPPAATVNGHVISEDQLDQVLQEMASSPAYQKDFAKEEGFLADQARQEASAAGQNPAQVKTVVLAGTASGPDNYSLQWVVSVLNLLIYEEAVHQVVVGEHKEPSPTAIAAAFAAEQASQPQVWRQFPSQLRMALARADAERAQIEPKASATTLKTDKQFYDQYKEYFWSRVCLSEVDITVPTSTGGVNWAASARQAQATVKAFDQGSVPSGQRYCLSQDQLIERSPAFFSHVGALPVGQAVAVKGDNSYQVVYVRSRSLVPWAPATQAVVNVVIVLGGWSSFVAQGVLPSGTGDTARINLMAKAHVTVDSQYGEWVGKPPDNLPAQAASPAEFGL